MEQLDAVQVVGAAHRLSNIHIYCRSGGGVHLVDGQRTVPCKVLVQLFQAFDKVGSKAFPIRAHHHLVAGLAPLLGNLEGVLAVVGLVLQGEVVVSLESLGQRFQVDTALQVQELVLGSGEAVKSVDAGVNLQLAVFKPASGFHVAQSDLAGNLHVLFFEGGQLDLIEGPALVAHHVVDADRGTLVVHLGDVARASQQGIKSLVHVLETPLQFFQVGLALVEYGWVLHEDGGRLGFTALFCGRGGRCSGFSRRGLGCSFSRGCRSNSFGSGSGFWRSRSSRRSFGCGRCGRRLRKSYCGCGKGEQSGPAKQRSLRILIHRISRLKFSDKCKKHVICVNRFCLGGHF